MISDSYARKIKKLSAKKLLLLGLCYTERSEKLVEEFDEFYHESLSQHFTNKLSKAYDYLLNNQPVTEETKEESRELEKVLPDSEDYPEMQGGLALNGLSMLCYCYRFLLTGQPENIIYILNLAFEIMDAIGIETNEDHDYEIESQKEFILLDKYLDGLNANTVINDTVIACLREISSQTSFVYRQ